MAVGVVPGPHCTGARPIARLLRRPLRRPHCRRADTTRLSMGHRIAGPAPTKVRPVSRPRSTAAVPLVRSRHVADAGLGRRRQYCRQSCRQRAYEQRVSINRAKDTPVPADAVVLSADEAADLADRVDQPRCAAEDVATALDEGAEELNYARSVRRPGTSGRGRRRWLLTYGPWSLKVDARIAMNALPSGQPSPRDVDRRIRWRGSAKVAQLRGPCDSEPSWDAPTPRRRCRVQSRHGSLG